MPVFSCAEEKKKKKIRIKNKFFLGDCVKFVLFFFFFLFLSDWRNVIQFVGGGE